MTVKEQQKYYENLYSNIDKKLYAERTTSFTKNIVKAINNNKKEDSKEVQDLMKEYKNGREYREFAEMATALTARPNFSNLKPPETPKPPETKEKQTPKGKNKN